MTALELPDIRKVYGHGDTAVVALDHATLTVGDDEIVALVGPSGSGKTTLLSIAGGLLAPTDGSVRGRRRTTSPSYTASSSPRSRREKVGFVFQQVNLVPFLTAAREPPRGRRLLRPSPRGGSTAPTTLLDELGLAPPGQEPAGAAVRRRASTASPSAAR